MRHTRSDDRTELCSWHTRQMLTSGQLSSWQCLCNTPLLGCKLHGVTSVDIAAAIPFQNLEMPVHDGSHPVLSSKAQSQRTPASRLAV